MRRAGTAPSPDPAAARAGTWWRTPLVRELAVVMAVKLALLIGLWFLFFQPSERVVVSDEVVSRMLLAPADTTTKEQ